VNATERHSAGGASLPGVTLREKVERLLGRLSEEQLKVEHERLQRAVESEADPVIRRFEDAPLEDEEISAEEEAAVQEARDELAAGAPTVPLEEIKRKYELQ
jgi:hypothetical protein